ncbi:MAG: UDP-N-acetylmuramoyl-L-alanyl-D-glutamate--2,6-diaminopimelate ligase, partial [Pseudophaeobacter sp.]
MRSNPNETPDSRPLSELGLTARGGADPLIKDLSVDSRRAGGGALFAALPGSLVH